MSEQKVQFVGFHAINGFMLPEYRQTVLHTVLSSLDKLSGERRSAINNQLKRYLNVPGFRNASLAPLPMKIKGAGSVFEKSPDFVAHVLMAWSELNSELRNQVYDLLKERGWELLPADADRTKLPGFLVTWPRQETYDLLNAAFSERNPQSAASENDVRLMVVWLSGRLPYEMADSDEEEASAE